MQIVTVSNTTLDAVAAQYMGDASQWIRIAVQNGLTDPDIAGIVTLQIPISDTKQSGGVPQQ